MESSKQVLQELSDLLGFEEGAEDVLEHLLTIDSREDLLDYLAQLLGSNNDKILTFVNHIVAFQHGEQVVGEEAAKPMAAKPTAAAAAPPPKPTPSPKKKNSPAQQSQSVVSKPVPTTSSTKTPVNTTQAPSPPKKDTPSPPPPPPPTQPLDVVVQDELPPPPPKSVPQKGKASFVCGCYGTKHKPLANCLVCGRIACDREGYDFCPFCGILLEKPPQGVSRTDPAWLHKERLLRFDRESAQRMIVIDDESNDDVAAAGMAWLTQEESDQAAAQQAEREETLRQRPKMQLNLAL